MFQTFFKLISCTKSTHYKTDRQNLNCQARAWFPFFKIYPRKMGKSQQNENGGCFTHPHFFGLTSNHDFIELSLKWIYCKRSCFSHLFFLVLTFKFTLAQVILWKHTPTLSWICPNPIFLHSLVSWLLWQILHLPSRNIKFSCPAMCLARCQPPCQSSWAYPLFLPPNELYCVFVRAYSRFYSFVKLNFQAIPQNALWLSIQRAKT